MKMDVSNDEISLKEMVFSIRNWINYLLSKWLTILVCVTVGSGLGFLYAYLTKPVYIATTTFVLEETGSSGGGLGQYANLANMVGIDIGGGANGMFTSDNILEIYKSRKMLQTVLLSTVDFNGKKQLLVDRFLEFNKVREKWSSRPELKNIDFSDDQGSRVLQDSVLGETIKEINKKYLTIEKLDKKSSIIKVSVSSKDELFAKALTEKVVSTVNDFYIQTKTKKAIENLAILQNQTDSVRAVMNGAIFSGATALDATPNLNPTRQVLRTSAQRSQFSIEANKLMLGELLKNLELSKISLRRETPLIQVIDQPILPLEKDKPGRLKSLLLGGILAGFISVMVLIMRKIFS